MRRSVEVIEQELGAEVPSLGIGDGAGEKPVRLEPLLLERYHLRLIACLVFPIPWDLFFELCFQCSPIRDAKRGNHVEAVIGFFSHGKIGLASVFGEFEAGIVVVDHGPERRSGCRPGECDLIGIFIDKSTFVEEVGRTSASSHEGFGGGGDGQPPAFVAGLDLHRHFPFVPERAVATAVVLVDGDNAGPPIGIGVRIEVALEIDADLCGPGIGYQARDGYAIRVGGFCRGAAIESLFDVHRHEGRPVGRGRERAELEFLLTIELGEACADLPDHVAHAADGVLLVPQTAFFTKVGVDVHGGRVFLSGQRGGGPGDNVAPVRVVRHYFVARAARISTVEQRHPRTYSLVSDLRAARRVSHDRK